MKLAHYFFSEPFDWKNTYINTLVIENPKMYRKMVSELISQQEGFDGDFVLSNDNTIIEINRNIEIITDIFRFEPSENKKFINAIQKELAVIANHEFPQEMAMLYGNINSAISNLIFASGLDITFDEINDISLILKTYNVRPDTEGYSLVEKLLSYMELCEKYLNRKLFVILNLHSCCSSDELELLFKDIIYRKHKALLIESHIEASSDKEKVLIVDDDMCEI